MNARWHMGCLYAGNMAMGCNHSRTRGDTRTCSRAGVNALALTDGQASVGTTEPMLEHLESEALSTVSRFLIGDSDLNRVGIAPHTLDVLVDPAELVARQDSWARFLLATASLRPHHARLPSASALCSGHWQSQDRSVRHGHGGSLRWRRRTSSPAVRA